MMGQPGMYGDTDRIWDEIKRLSDELRQLKDAPYVNSIGAAGARGYSFVPLTTPLTSASWDGDSFSTIARTLIDLSVVFGLPACAKAIAVRMQVRDSASAATNSLIFLLSCSNVVGEAAVAARPSGLPDDYWIENSGIVPCDINGDIYYACAASGAATMDVYIQIFGYWI